MQRHRSWFQGFTLVELLVVMAVIAILISLLLPAVQHVRHAAARTKCANNLHQIGLALHNYHDVNGHLPAAAVYDKDGKPLLSWRVLLLPYLEQDALYRQFHLDEPWDSAHNKKLLAQMPKVYAPVAGEAKGTDKTHYRVFTGKGTVFEGDKGIRLTDIPDGTSNTILVVEAGDAVPWTKPADLPSVQTIKFEFIINLRTAKALSIKISDNLLSLADEVIE